MKVLEYLWKIVTQWNILITGYKTNEIQFLVTADKWFSEDVHLIYNIYQRWKSLTCQKTQEENLNKQQKGKHPIIKYLCYTNYLNKISK